MNEITRTRKVLEFLPFLLFTLLVAGFFAYCVATMLVPSLQPVEKTPTSDPTSTIEPEATGTVVEGIYVNPAGGAYCFQDEVLLGAVPDPRNCEQVLAVKTGWDTGERTGVWHYNVPAAYWNTEDEAWDCYFQGNYAAGDSLEVCLASASDVAFTSYQERPRFVVALPNLLAASGEGFPCVVGNEVVGYAQNPNGCNSVYLDVLTAHPYRV